MNVTQGSSQNAFGSARYPEAVTGSNTPHNEDCPTCGAVMVRDYVANSLPRRQRAVYECVLRAGPAGATSARIFDYVYGTDPGGGPASTNVISVLVSHINKRIEQYGVAIRGKRGPMGAFKIVRL